MDEVHLRERERERSFLMMLPQVPQICFDVEYLYHISFGAIR